MNKDETGAWRWPVWVREGHVLHISQAFPTVFVVRWSWPQVQSFTEGVHHSSGERGKENRAKVSQRSNNISK